MSKLFEEMAQGTAEARAYMEGEWLAARPKPTAARISRALAILDRLTQNAPDPGDELPDGYVSIRETDEYKQALGAK
jgi:hypothetical protein